MLVGVFKPRIYLPDIEYTDGQLDNILLHELNHLRRRDVWLKWFAALVVSVHWFNPIAYLMRREFNRACELACDEAVIRKLDGAAKQSYGDTLISVVAESRYPVGVMSVTMCEEKKKLKERLVAIMNYKKKTKIVVFITAILAVTLTGCALAFGASFGAKNSDLIEMEIIYSNVTEYSHSEQIKWDERTYSPSSDYQDGFKVGKQIGFIHDENGYKYKIYECEGLSTDRYLVAYYDVIMSIYDLFAADANYLTFAEVEKMNGHPQSTVRKYLGEANGVLSGFWGDIYELADGSTAILYYGNDSRVENIVVNAKEAQYDISLADLRQLAAKGDNLLFEDFNEYKGRDVGFGLYILHFTVEGGYELFVAAGTEKPMYATLEIPGVEETIDIRYDDIDAFISKYPVPNELSGQIYGYLEVMSIPTPNNFIGMVYPKIEYDAVLDMGVTALPTLTGILNSGDMSLRGTVAAVLVQDIITAESGKPRSDWRDGVLQSAASDVERWSRGLPMEDNPVTSDEKIEPTTKATSNIETVNNINTENISILAENCNILMDISLDGNFQYDYDDSIFEVETNANGSTVIITAKLKANAKAGLMDMITIYIPDEKYTSFTVESKSAGITIPPLNTNINITSDKGAVGIKIPDNFDKSISYTATNASGAIDFGKNATNFTLIMAVQNSSIRLAENFPQYKSGSKQYEFRSGDGYAKINIDVTDSALTVRTDK